MRLITDEYRGLNRALHEEISTYGTSGSKYVEHVLTMARAIKAESILDYGCGKRTLEAVLVGEYPVRNYDPAIPGLDAMPEPADLVVCTDVMEHVEPECVEAVLDHIQQLTRKAVLMSIATTAANKVLADGRNAHLIVQPIEWWFYRLQKRFRVRALLSVGPTDFIYTGKPA